MVDTQQLIRYRLYGKSVHAERTQNLVPDSRLRRGEISRHFPKQFLNGFFTARHNLYSSQAALLRPW